MTVTGRDDAPMAVEVVGPAALAWFFLAQNVGPTEFAVGATAATHMRGTTDGARDRCFDRPRGLRGRAGPQGGEGAYPNTANAVGACRIDATYGTFVAHLPVTVTP